MKKADEIELVRRACQMLLHDLRVEFGDDVLNVVVGDDEEIAAELTRRGAAVVPRPPFTGHGLIIVDPVAMISLYDVATVVRNDWATYLCLLAKYSFQAAVSEGASPRFAGLPFPTCPVHPLESMEPTTIDGVASWTCRGDLPAVPIGQLGDSGIL
jgi:hypothetical protein